MLAQRGDQRVGDRQCPVEHEPGLALAGLDLIESAGTPGDNAVKAVTHTGMKVDLQVVEPDQFGNVLQHLTGSKAHNVQLREAAVRKGFHVSQYGIVDDSTGETRRHGPHHGAQKSTRTGTSDSTTSAWKLLSVTSVTGPAISVSLSVYFKKYSAGAKLGY